MLLLCLGASTENVDHMCPCVDADGIMYLLDGGDPLDDPVMFYVVRGIFRCGATTVSTYIAIRNKPYELPIVHL